MHFVRKVIITPDELKRTILLEIEEQSLYEGTNFNRIVDWLRLDDFKSHTEKEFIDEIKDAIRALVKEGKISVGTVQDGKCVQNCDVEASFSEYYFYSPTRSVSTHDFE